MSLLDQDRVMSILAEAVELPASGRRAFLDSTCAGEQELRREVEELLACADPAAAAFEAAAQQIVQPDPDRIGHYQILEPIGEGGMAIVYKAQQQNPVKRVVAVKLIKLGMDTRQFVARFEAERQALALMDHPNVARVYDAGSTDTGRPYFVMEYVPGRPILEYCDERHLGVRERLELFIVVCDAVEHAHRKGIIHRDIKNSNVLITQGDSGVPPAPKVIDFGVAKAIQQPLTDRTLQTEQGQLIGTPEYMSPEQAARGVLDIDTRTDVYSLGVLLYELIAGVQPISSHVLRGAGYEQVQQIIRETEARRPSTVLSTLADADAARIAQRRRTALPTLLRELRSELEWVPLKAMRKDREQRYRSAAELADDVRHYLDGRPLIAGPESAAYRARKFLGRHRSGVAAAAAMLLLLLGGIAATTWQAYRATRAEREVRAALADMNEVNRFLTDDLLASASPEVTRGKELTVREAVDRAADTVARRLSGRPQTEAAVRAVLADTYDALGHTDRGLSHAQAALDILRREHGPDHARTLAAARVVGRALANLNRHAEAEPMLRDAVARAERSLGEEHPVTLGCLGALAMTLRLQERFAESEPLYRRVLAGNRRAHGPASEEAAQALNNLAVLLNTQGRSSEAEPLYRESLAIRQERLGTDHPSYLSTQDNLARVLESQGKLADAESLLRQVLRDERRVLKDDHPGTTSTMNSLASILVQQQRYEDAAVLHGEALMHRRRVLGDDHIDTLQSMNNFALALFNSGKPDESEALFVEVVERRRRVLGPKHPYTLNSVLGLARVYERQDRVAEAEALIAPLCEAETLKTFQPPNQAKLLEHWGSCLWRLKQAARAEPVLLDAHARLIQTRQSSAPEMRRALRALAEICERTERPEEAAKWRAELAALAPTTAPTTSPSPVRL